MVLLRSHIGVLSDIYFSLQTSLDVALHNYVLCNVKKKQQHSNLLLLLVLVEDKTNETFEQNWVVACELMMTQRPAWEDHGSIKNAFPHFCGLMQSQSQSQELFGPKSRNWLNLFKFISASSATLSLSTPTTVRLPKDLTELTCEQ